MSGSKCRTPKDALIDGMYAPKRQRVCGPPDPARTPRSSLPTSGAARSRPPCPPQPEPNSFSVKAQEMDRQVMMWRAQYETHDEYRARRRRELARMKNRPKRQRAAVAEKASLDAYRARLMALPAEDFACVDGVYLAEYQFKGLHTDMESLPDNIRARALRTLIQVAAGHGYHAKGIVSQVGTWTTDGPDGRVKVYETDVPAGETRMYCGRNLLIQEDVQHPLGFLAKDEIPVGGRRRRRRTSPFSTPRTGESAPSSPALVAPAGGSGGTEGRQRAEAAAEAAIERAREASTPTSTYFKMAVPGVEVEVCSDEDALTEDEG